MVIGSQKGPAFGRTSTIQLQANRRRHAVMLAFVNPCALVGVFQIGLRGLVAIQAFGGALNARDNFAAGKYFSAAMEMVGAYRDLFLKELRETVRVGRTSGVPLLR